MPQISRLSLSIVGTERTFLVLHLKLPLEDVSTGSIEKGVLQYSENMVTRVSSTIFPFVRSVQVHSINTFLDK